jgi:radical SAM protein with 4Fe4S-binding SPASM domain
LRNDDFPSGLNAVVFLLHKPTGHGAWQDVLEPDDPRLRDFFEQVDARHRFKVGLDSCTVPGALSHCRSILRESLDTCEGGRFSCYIGPDMSMVPCSFDQTGRYRVQLGGPGRPGPSILEAWNSVQFDVFRHRLRAACPSCGDRDACMGGCPLMPGIVLCNRDNRDVQMEAR